MSPYRFANEDTICAISTPPGQGGIGVIRVSGQRSFEIGDRIFHAVHKKKLHKAPTHTLHYGKIVDPRTGEVLDEVLAAVMRSPKSYTCEDVLELSCHGNTPSLMKILSLLVREGAREALPGEFTRRAFLNGRIDLVQAEAVMDFISAESEIARELALKHLNGDFSQVILKIRERMVSLLSNLEGNIDFSQEDIEFLSEPAAVQKVLNLLEEVDGLLNTARDGRIVREGFLVALAGRPNVGKSTLLNTLLGNERAIVTAFPGTTRDTLEESLLVHGVKVRLVDTAGIRSTDDPIEKEGIKRAEETIRSADLVLWLVDATAGMTPEEDKNIEKYCRKNYLILFNKIDLVNDSGLPRTGRFSNKQVLKISSFRKSGIRELEAGISEACLQLTRWTGSEAGAVVIRRRHEQALREAKASLLHSLDSLKGNMSPEFVALDLKGAIDHLGKIVGITTPDDVLNQIFKDFCIGK
ncbi:MAG: tRNA uridine-5-carboxymethylaminomethyl(34) synthesis GTPase MnmE [Nitrospirae bacterium]|nr:tRNA uridine-5-carboxymethylaminomethyl(34) synthesis GTPase MnmE [Nitrospirota bacterium]